jgi:hypothetical protein
MPPPAYACTTSMGRLARRRLARILRRGQTHQPHGPRGMHGTRASHRSKPRRAPCLHEVLEHVAEAARIDATRGRDGRLPRQPLPQHCRKLARPRPCCTATPGRNCVPLGKRPSVRPPRCYRGANPAPARDRVVGSARRTEKGPLERCAMAACWRALPARRAARLRRLRTRCGLAGLCARQCRTARVLRALRAGAACGCEDG